MGPTACPFFTVLPAHKCSTPVPLSPRCLELTLHTNSYRCLSTLYRTNDITRFRVSERFDLRYFVCPWIHKKMRHVGCVFDQGWSSKLYVSFLLSIYECCDVFFLKQTKICYLNKTSKMAHVALKKFVTMATVWAKKAKNVIF